MRFGNFVVAKHNGKIVCGKVGDQGIYLKQMGDANPIPFREVEPLLEIEVHRPFPEHFKVDDFRKFVISTLTDADPVNLDFDEEDSRPATEQQARWRPEVVAFADAMERKLRANDWKGGWKDFAPGALMDRVREEFGEAQRAYLAYPRDTDEYRQNLLDESADVANMLMMVCDVVGAIATPLREPQTPAQGAEVSPLYAEGVCGVLKEAAQMVGCYDQGSEGMTEKLRAAARQTLDPKSVAGILLREHDNVDQAIRYAKRMAQRYADSRSLMAMEYLDAAQELEAWAKNKPR